MVISEPKSAHLREVLLFAFNWKKSATEAHRMLEEVHGNHALSKSQCYRWFKKFQSGDFELDNEPRGKPRQKFEDAELQALLDDDSTQTQEKLAKQLQVPHELSERQQERRLVTCEGLLARHEKKSFLHPIVTSDEKSIHFSNPMLQKSWGLLGQFPKRKPRPNRLGKKAMLCVWWDQTGVVYIKLLKPGETVNTSRYEQQMHSLREALNEKRPELREKHNKLILQHDNAPAHNATVVKNTIKDLGWELLPHPPYSPDLAPSDYHLFTSLGHALKSQEFSNSDILRKWLVDWFDSKGIEFFRQGIRKLPERWSEFNGRSRGDKDGDFTYISERGSSTIDYCILSQGSLQILLDFKVDDQLYSDHHPLVLTIKGQNFNEKKTKREDYNITRYRWSADGLAMFKMKLEELREKNIPASDDLVYTFNQRILEAMSSAKITYSIKGGPRKSKPWFDKDCYDMKKLAKESLKKYRKTNRLEDRECYASSRKKYLALLDLKRKGFDNEKQEILRNAKDSKTFWKTIALYKSTSMIQGEISIQDWLNFYRELMTTEKNLRICNLHNVISQNDPILDSEITNADIYKEIAGLRSNKACGPGGIPNEVSKTLPDSYILLLKQLYNSVMTTGKYPAIWTNSTIHPIFKNGYKNSPSNYREFGDIYLLLYADDIAIIGESRMNLQKKIKILKDYLDENLMTLNESKSKIMVFRNGGKPSNKDRWFWNDKPITITSRYTYLGFPLTPTITTTHPANYFKGKALTAINATHPILIKSKAKSINLSIKLFDTIVRAVLMYAAPLWATEHKDLLDNIQDIFIRRFLNLPRYTPGYLIRLETGRISLSVTALKLTLKYWLRVLNMSSDRLPRICFNRTRELSNASGTPIGFIKKLTNLLNNNGSPALVSCDDPETLRSAITGLLKTAADQSIQNDLTGMDKSKLYSHYKDIHISFMTEGYLLGDFPFPVVRLLAQVRILSSFFRENHTKMLCGEDPICTFCNSKLKNEITHYIFDCSALKEERRTLMLKTGQLCASLPSIIDNMTQNKYIATAFYGFHKSISQKKAKLCLYCLIVQYMEKPENLTPNYTKDTSSVPSKPNAYRNGNLMLYMTGDHQTSTEDLQPEPALFSPVNTNSYHPGDHQTSTEDLQPRPAMFSPVNNNSHHPGDHQTSTEDLQPGPAMFSPVNNNSHHPGDHQTSTEHLQPGPAMFSPVNNNSHHPGDHQISTEDLQPGPAMFSPVNNNSHHPGDHQTSTEHLQPGPAMFSPVNNNSHHPGDHQISTEDLQPGPAIYTPGYIIRLETGRISLSVTALKLTLKYWLRVLNMSSDRLPRMCFNRTRELSNASGTPIGFIKKLTNLINNKGSPALVTCDDPETLRSAITGLLKTAADQSIQNDLTRMDKSKLYSHYKDIHTSFTEGYLLGDFPFPVVRLLAQVRILSSFFRENHTKMLCGEDPICTFCNSKLKNEITHYIFDCYALKEERRTLMLKTGQLCASHPSIIDNMTQNKYIATAFYGFHKSISQKKAK
ncbi:SETMAR [Cordylochernes scorpioides]|uniref:SETMAR n=1 Tax=Cordylochernes scorpioides TaxID=51811 RepID=A0ABY6L8N1_9ARAC|nr:SETMAR [Cordylochernes scorpioides]